MLNLRPLQGPALALAALLIATGLGACQQTIVPPCPSVRVDNATASLTKFKDGGGHEANDVEYRADIVGFKGICNYTRKRDSVDVMFDLDLAVTGGAAAKGGSAPLYYFVAVPQFFPDTNGKRVMQATAKLPVRASQRENITETNVHVILPLKKEETGASYDVYVGFQLDAAQLDYNRAQSTR